MKIHGHSGKRRTPTYLSWAGMIQRCTNPNHKFYPDYGGRGISVSLEWRDFRVFLVDMGKRPRNKTLDRKNVNGNYCKDNCKWSTKIQQERNKR